MINEEIINKITRNLMNSLENNKLTLKMAKEIIEKAEQKAEEINVSVVITMVDDSGNLVAQHKMDDSILISTSVSFSKAYTAIALKMPTEKLYNLVLPGKAFYGLENMDGGKLCVLGGGIPVMKNERFIGAIGVSGGSIEQDIIIAQAALK